MVPTDRKLELYNEAKNAVNLRKKTLATKASEMRANYNSSRLNTVAKTPTVSKTGTISRTATTRRSNVIKRKKQAYTIYMRKEDCIILEGFKNKSQREVNAIEYNK